MTFYTVITVLAALVAEIGQIRGKEVALGWPSFWIFFVVLFGLVGWYCWTMSDERNLLD